MTIGEFLKEKRIENDLTQQNLADAIHVDRSLISRIENNEFKPRKEMLINICSLLNIEYNELVKYAAEEYRNKKKIESILLIIAISISILSVLSLTIPFLKYAGYKNPKNQTHHLVYASLTSISLGIHQPLPLLVVILSSIYSSVLLLFLIFRNRISSARTKLFLLSIGLALLLLYLLSLFFSIVWFYRYYL